MLDAKLHEALRVPAPEIALPLGPYRVKSSPRRWPGARQLALAASIAGIALLVGVLWIGVPRQSLASAVVEHMAHEPQAWVRGDALAATAVAPVLARSGVALRDGMPAVSYASSCWFRGRYVPHLVVLTPGGPVTIMVLPEEKVAGRVAFDEGGYRGVIVPAQREEAARNRSAMIEGPTLRARAALVCWIREDRSMRKLGSIVVGIDFSDSSRVALGHAMRIAGWSGAALHPVHIVDTGDHPNRSAHLTPLQQKIRSGLHDEAQYRWTGFAHEAGAPDRLTLEVGDGSRFGGIYQRVVDRRADLLVLGAIGHGRPHIGLGTLASGCIRGVPADVLVVREDFPGPFRTVVVGVDFSETSRRALEAGAMLAANEAAKLWTVFVVPDAHGAALPPSRDVEQELEMFTRAVTDAWPGLEVRCDVYPHTGHRSGILEFATAVHGDIVVLGTRGRTNLRDVVLGSTAEKVLRDSLIAVWACKPAEDAPDRA